MSSVKSALIKIYPTFPRVALARVRVHEGQRRDIIAFIDNAATPLILLGEEAAVIIYIFSVVNSRARARVCIIARHYFNGYYKFFIDPFAM